MFNNGGMRNLGANSNQPLITNQNDIQIFDNVTQVAGKHTVKVGGSYTHRSREILNADTIVGRFDFNQNLTSSCAGITSGCTAAANTGFDFASFLLGYASNASRTLFDPGTYTETETGVCRLHPGRHPRHEPPDGQRRACAGTCTCRGSRRTTSSPTSTSRPAGSSSPPTTRRSTASRWAAICRPTRRPTSDRGSASPTTSPAAARRWSAAATACSGTSPPAAPRRRRRRTSRSSRRRRTTTNFGTNIILSNGLAAPPGVNLDRRRPEGPRDRRSSSISATRTRTTSTSTCSGRSAPTT